jgi:hypothetical protein
MNIVDLCLQLYDVGSQAFQAGTLYFPCFVNLEPSLVLGL